MASFEDRRRRALYRATHRGTKEMDWLLGRYAKARLPAMNEVELAEIEDFITVPDPDLQAWIMAGVPADPSHEPLVGRIRAFHGLENATDKAST